MESLDIAQYHSSQEEVDNYKKLVALQKSTPIPDTELLANMGLFQTRSSFSRMLFLHNLYLKTLNTHGVIMEFGVRWGQTLALFSTFRSMYEPYNLSRKIVGFDTFEGFPSVSDKDGSASAIEEGAYSVPKNYEDYLTSLLNAHEGLSPRSNIKKHQLIKGNVEDTLPSYLEAHPETVISLAYFDLDLYSPTKKCLELIRPHIAKNTIIGFDELALAEFPGETQALKDAWGISNFNIYRDPTSPQQSYIVVGDMY
jgi:hypothetical protein